MDTVTSSVPKTEKEWKEARNATGSGSGWRFDKTASKGICFQFDTPIMKSDVRDALFEAIKEKNPSARFIKKYEEDYKKGSESVLMRRNAILTRTSKMGCYSWNIPAGPPRHGGCCPASAVGFDSVALGLPGTAIDNVKLMNSIKRLKTVSDSNYIDSIPGIKDPGEAKRRFLCNGCYALKNSYGNPSMVIIMEWRKKWLQGWALKTGMFRDVMVATIRNAQQISERQRRNAKSETQRRLIPNPAFFRIHDSGDFFSEEYLEAWLSIVRDMSDINFWAPTRVWTSSSGVRWLENLIRKGVPRNLALRPSGIFFDAPEPYIHGLSGGTSANLVSFTTERGKVRIRISDTGTGSWACPAYLPTIVGGGAMPRSKAKDAAAKARAEKRRAKEAAKAAAEARPNPANPNAGEIKKAQNYAKKVADEMLKYRGWNPKKAPREQVDAVFAMLSRPEHERVYVRGFDMGADPKEIAVLIQDAEWDLKPNPVDQSFDIYKSDTDFARLPRDSVFYDAIYDLKQNSFVLDAHGRPLLANDKNLKAFTKSNPDAQIAVKRTQAYEAIGNCGMAVDSNKAKECRVCWGTTGGKRDDEVFRLPVIYAKH